MSLRIPILSVLVLAGAVTASAQSLQVGGPTNVPTAPDFATNDVGDPWDFAELSDYVYQFSLDGAGQSSWAAKPVLSGGRLLGISRSPNPQITLQFAGVLGALNTVGRTGFTHPIDTSKYNRLSIRVRRSVTPAATNETMDVNWAAESGGGGVLMLTRGYEGVHGHRYYNQSPVASQGSTGFHVYKIDLDQPGFKYGSNWTGIKRGLAIRLGNSNQLVNAQFEVDWVRLSKRGAATKSISWSGFPGSVTLTATHSQTGDVVQIFPDNGSSATTFGASGSFTWDYGFLTPGTWTIAATSGGTVRTRVMTIDPPPVVHVTDPDVAGGRDFASTVLADAWDLTNVQDVLRRGRMWHVQNVSYSEDGLRATTAGPDPFVQPIDDWDDPPGTEVLIDANTYHRLSFTIEYTDTHLYTPAGLVGSYAGVVRVAWRRAHNNGGPYTQTQDIVLLDGGPYTYSFDLASLNLGGGGGNYLHELELPVTDLWQGSMANLRIDPDEPTPTARQFRLANVRLAADDAPNANGFFTIRWKAFDATFASQVPGTNGADATVTLYRDTDMNPSNGKQQIVSGLDATAGQYMWNAAGLGAGLYHIYVEITDAAGNTQGRYSTGPLRIASAIPHAPDNNSNGMGDGWESAYLVSSASGDEDNDGVSNVQEYQRATHPRLANTWQLSEGATGFFRERLALANPDPSPADVTVKFLREGAPPITRAYTVMGRSRLTINVNEVAGLGNSAVSAVITSTTGGVVAERTMFWDASRYAGHSGKALQTAGTTWYLAEGEASVFDTWILLANANASAASVTIQYLLESGAPVTRTYTVPGNARTTVYANAVPGVAGKAFSSRITSSIPITVERAMYFSNSGLQWNGGHESAAVRSPSKTWFVAEGRTGPFFDTYLLLANPGNTASTVTVRYLLPGGATKTTTEVLPKTSRKTIYVDSVPGLQDTEVSASITASEPIIVERAMYWPGNSSSWNEAHNSAGITQTGTKWLLAEGEVGGSAQFQTFVLLANPSGSDANVRVTYLLASGAPVVSTFVVPANSRVSKSALEFVPPGNSFGVLVESLNNVPIVVERAMYWNALGTFWKGGTNETATRLR